MQSESHFLFKLRDLSSHLLEVFHEDLIHLPTLFQMPSHLLREGRLTVTHTADDSNKPCLQFRVLHQVTVHPEHLLVPSRASEELSDKLTEPAQLYLPKILV